jgi:hypothetical protein
MGCVQFIQDPLQDRFCLGQNLMVPEAQNPVTHTLKRCRSLGIPLFAMLAAIGFDNQLFFDTGKVGDIWAKLHLPSDFAASHLSRPQVLP